MIETTYICFLGVMFSQVISKKELRVSRSKSFQNFMVTYLHTCIATYALPLHSCKHVTKKLFAIGIVRLLNGRAVKL